MTPSTEVYCQHFVAHWFGLVQSLSVLLKFFTVNTSRSCLPTKGVAEVDRLLAMENQLRHFFTPIGFRSDSMGLIEALFRLAWNSFCEGLFVVFLANRLHCFHHTEVFFFFFNLFLFEPFFVDSFYFSSQPALLRKKKSCPTPQSKRIQARILTRRQMFSFAI